MKKYLPQSTGALWWGAALFFLLSIFFLLPIQPNDYWWYLRLGDDILRTGHIPTADAYSFTRAGVPLVNHSWLSAVLFFLLNRWGGLAATVLLRAIPLAGTYSIVWKMTARAGVGTRLAAGITLLAALTSGNNWAMRPQVLAYPLFALTLAEIYRGARVRWWALSVLMIFWVNLHGSFVLGFLLVGAAWVGDGKNRRALTISLAGMAAASLLNPRGWRAWEYVWTLLRDPAGQKLGAEWQPPTFAHWQSALFFIWLALLALGILWQFRAGKRTLSATELLWLAGFGAMGLLAVRYGVWFALVAAPVTAKLLAPVVPSRWRAESRGIPALNGAFLALFLLLPLALLPGFRARWWAESPPVLSTNTPVAAAEWLNTHPEFSGNTFADLDFSSYLIFAARENPVWIDTRFELYPLSQWNEYRAIIAAPKDWKMRLEATGADIFILNPAATPELISAIGASLRWQKVYQDETAVIFSHATQ